jgi:hypothetical protein
VQSGSIPAPRRGWCRLQASRALATSSLSRGEAGRVQRGGLLLVPAAPWRCSSRTYRNNGRRSWDGRFSPNLTGGERDRLEASRRRREGGRVPAQRDDWGKGLVRRRGNMQGRPCKRYAGRPRHGRAGRCGVVGARRRSGAW